MANYRIFEKETFQGDIARISRSGLVRIKEKLREHVYFQLRLEPHFGPQIKGLKNWDPRYWRYRIGAWWFFCESKEKGKIVFMTTADRRGGAYERNT